MFAALVLKALSSLAVLSGVLGSVQVQPAVSDARLLGQRIMVGFSGTAPSAGLLDEVREGRVGSVILFGGNVGSFDQVRALTGALQRAARAGGNPPLLIATDQEGGQVKRLEAGPPSLSPPAMAASGSVSVAAAQGHATGRYLKSLGINMDLAPVLDVPSTPRAFIWQQGRAFSFDPAAVAAYGGAFASGLQSAGVAATGKHFPGLGSATVDTDSARVQLQPSAAALRPYQSLIRGGLQAVMLSVAGYPRLDASGTPAALSRPIVRDLLRGRLGFAGVTITDSLAAPTGHDEVTAGVLAARAGADILLYTDSAPGALHALEAAMARGEISRSDAEASYERIVRLKRAVAR